MSSAPSVAPFRGIRYHAKKVSAWDRITAPPYDVISPVFRKILHERDPHNVVRLILGYEFPQDTPQDNRYTRAASTWKKWQEEGILIRDSEPSFYLYEQTFTLQQGRPLTRRGFLALKRLEEFEGGKVRRHEKTLSGPKADRLNLTKACQANFSPIFGLYSDKEQFIAQVLESYFKKTPELDFVDEEKVGHRLWRVSDPALFKKLNDYLETKSLFIADGHHRYETALNYRRWMQETLPGGVSDSSPLNYVMTFFANIADPGLVILPTHRVLHHWPRFDPSQFLEKLKDLFDFQTFPSRDREKFLKAYEDTSLQGNAFGLLLPGEEAYHLISLSQEKGESLEERLVDTAVLHQLVLNQLLGFSEENEKDPRYLRFVKEIGEAMMAREESGVQAVFLVRPIAMDVFTQVVEAGLVLPPKTTFFYPKLLTGLVMNPLNPSENIFLS